MTLIDDEEQEPTVLSSADTRPAGRFQSAVVLKGYRSIVVLTDTTPGRDELISGLRAAFPGGETLSLAGAGVGEIVV